MCLKNDSVDVTCSYYDKEKVVMKFTIPVGSNKKWWQFWKKNKYNAQESEKALNEMLSNYKKDIKIDEDYWFPDGY